MATGPERKIERLLRAYAQKRRSDAGQPPTPSPLMHQRLQAEVAQQFGSEPAEGRSWLERFVAAHWVKLAAATCLALLLGVTFIMLQPPAEIGVDGVELAHQRLLTRSVSPEPTKVAPSWPGVGMSPAQFGENAMATDSLRPAAPAPAELPGLLGRPNGELAGVPARDLAYAGVKSDHESVKSLDSTGVNLEARRQVSLTVGSSSAAAVTAPAASESVQPSAKGRQLTAFAQWFSNAAAPAPQDNAPEQIALAYVLNNFRLEQIGDKVQIADADGSVYTGFVQPGDPAQLVPGTFATDSQAKQATALRPSEPQHAKDQAVVSGVARMASGQMDAQQAYIQNYFFRVTGTNRTLNQQVVFTGQLIAVTNGVVSDADFSARPAARKQQEELAEQIIPHTPPPQIHSWRVTGAAVLGEAQKITIEAVPVSAR